MGTDSENLNLLQTKAREWARLVVDLHKRQVPPEYEGGKRALLNSAKTIKTMIEKITGPLPYLAEMNQLGFIPLIIGGAAILAAIAAVTKWTLDYRKFIAQVEERQRLIAAGVNPTTAAKIAGGAYDGGVWTTVKKVAPFVVLGGLVIYGYKKLG